MTGNSKDQLELRFAKYLKKNNVFCELTGKGKELLLRASCCQEVKVYGGK